MNETMFVYLDFEPGDPEIESVINRMDELIAGKGWKYAGISNMYLPVDPAARDESCLRVIRALKHAPWLKPYRPRVLTGNLTNAVSLKDIDVSGMSAPSAARLQRYEDYFCLTNSLAHPIIVDEDGRIRDGYISYLLAWKYSAPVDILTTWSHQPVKKIVTGRHVRWDGTEYEEKSQTFYRWIYDKKEAVVPGDILLVHTRKGPDHMRVSRIDHITGTTACSKYRKVMRNETAYLRTP